MMVVRVNLRTLLAALCVAMVLFTLYWSHCGDLRRPPISAVLSGGLLEGGPERTTEVECVINGQYSVTCRRDSNDVYLPFSFLHKYFEVYGKLTSSNGVERFDWSHSYGKVYHPKRKYDPSGTFTTFENYNVEVRERVKCISGIEGVPVSTQWDPKGFYYPTQIAQFGLAHYSKNITEPAPKRRTIEDADKVLENWIVTNDATMVRELDPKCNSNVLRWSTTSQMSSQVWAKLSGQDFVLSMDVALKPNASVTVVLQHRDKKETVYLHYVTNNQLIYAQGEHIYHGIGTMESWRRLSRDLIVDLQKGWALQDRPKRKSPRTKFKVSSIILCGSGALDNLTLSSADHTEPFSAAARWLVKNQRDRGGWPVNAKRRIAQGVELKPGWHSAMSQGHAISLLSRAYSRSADVTYLKAARKALYLLDVPADKGGVKAVWMDKYVWYEEYPTTPPLFVLNGFIYTLLGLYDLHVIEGENSISLAKKMFDDGMVSLKTLLPLFDTGSGSFYDLRHFTMGVSPNIARWDYHATHVNQLYLLAGLDDDPILINTAKRWEGYMMGKRAAHN